MVRCKQCFQLAVIQLFILYVMFLELNTISSFSFERTWFAGRIFYVFKVLLIGFTLGHYLGITSPLMIRFILSCSFNENS